jgi:hypothetical protein
VSVYDHHIPLIPIFKREEEKVIPLFHQPEKPPTSVLAPSQPVPIVQRIPAPQIEEEYSIIGIPLSEQKRVFSEKTSKFEARIATDPWDTEAWTSLLLEAQSKDIRIARNIYERFLAQFPTAVCIYGCVYLIVCRGGIGNNTLSKNCLLKIMKT